MEEADIKRIRKELDEGPDLNQAQDPAKGTVNSSFKHTPLPNPESEIRLFEFQSTAGHNDIKLELRSWKLVECPQYSAISYLWGAVPTFQAIDINGKTLATTANAYYALQQVFFQLGRNKLRTKYFWMDSICINQQDLDEKGKQVYLMGDIYERAAEGLTCVGSHADDSALVVEVLGNAESSKYASETYRFTRAVLNGEVARDADETDSKWQSLAERIQTEWQKSVARRTGVSSDQSWPMFLAATLEFFNRPYWHRMWIVQENLLADSVVLLCGSDRLNLHCFAPCLRFSPRLHWEWVTPWKMSRMFAVLNSSHHTGASERGTRIPAASVLEDLYDNDCADFRDRVYALLRIMSWTGAQGSGDIDIRPDYTITKLGLLRQVAVDVARSEVHPADEQGIIRNLYVALRLSIESPEVAELIAQTSATSEKPANFDTIDAVLRQPLLKSKSLFGVQLESSSDGLDLPTSCEARGLAVFSIGDDALSKAQLQIPLKANGTTVGWTSAKAQPGDYLIEEGIPGDNAVEMLCFIVRSESPGNAVKCKILGHAMLFRGFSLPTKWQHFSLDFDADDFIAMVALQEHMRSRDYSVEAIETFLYTPPTRAEYSSWAVLEGSMSAEDLRVESREASEESGD